jgi:hypothetical protein
LEVFKGFGWAIAAIQKRLKKNKLIRKRKHSFFMQQNTHISGRYIKYPVGKNINGRISNVGTRARHPE